MHCTVCTAVFEELQYANAYSAAAAVVVFFALTDRASTISSSTYVYLVDMVANPVHVVTWSTGQENVRGTTTKLQGEHENKTKHKSETKTTKRKEQ